MTEYNLPYDSSAKEVRDKLYSEISRISGINCQRIIPLSHLSCDLGLDSMGFLELASSIEDIFNVNIPNEEIPSMKTAGCWELRILESKGLKRALL